MITVVGLCNTAGDSSSLEVGGESLVLLFSPVHVHIKLEGRQIMLHCDSAIDSV